MLVVSGLLKSKKVLIISISVLVAVGILSTWIVVAKNSSSESSVEQKVAEKPEFQTVLPAGQSIQDVQGQILRPPNSEPVFSYNDKINGKPITVTQQPLPEAFKNNPEAQLSDLAKKFNATTQIEAGNAAVYIGTSAKGPQSVLFIKQSLLILIKSQEKIDEGAWTIYINSLV